MKRELEYGYMVRSCTFSVTFAGRGHQCTDARLGVELFFVKFLAVGPGGVSPEDRGCE